MAYIVEGWAVGEVPDPIAHSAQHLYCHSSSAVSSLRVPSLCRTRHTLCHNAMHKHSQEPMHPCTHAPTHPCNMHTCNMHPCTHTFMHLLSIHIHTLTHTMHPFTHATCGDYLLTEEPYIRYVHVHTVGGYAAHLLFHSEGLAGDGLLQ